jgi:hypothetical protein
MTPRHIKASQVRGKITMQSEAFTISLSSGLLLLLSYLYALQTFDFAVEGFKNNHKQSFSCCQTVFFSERSL